MKKTMKVIGKILLGVLLLVLAAVLAHPLWVGPSVRGTVNGLLPGLGKVKASLDCANVNVYSGNVSVERLKIGNVDGVKADISGETRPEAVSLGSLKVDFSPLSLVTSRIHVNKIDIADLHASCFNVNGTNNFQCMATNVKRELGIKDKDDDDDDDEPSDTRVMVDEFTLTGLKVWLGTDFTIDCAKSDMNSGVVNVTAVRLANPPGANADNAFSVKSVLVELDPATLYTKCIHFRKIVIDEPFASYGNVDVNGETMTNFDYILGHVVPKDDGKSDEEKEKKKEKKPEDESEQVKVVIDEFTVKNLGVKLWSVPTIRVPIDITVRDIGKSSDGKNTGATLQEAYETISKKVMEALSAAGGNIAELGKAGFGALQGGAKAVLDSQAAKDAQKLISSGTNAVGDKAQKAFGTMGDGAKKGFNAMGDGAKKGLDAMGDGAKKTLGTVGDGARKGLDAVGGGLKKLNPFGK